MTLAVGRSASPWVARPAVSGFLGGLVWLGALVVSHPTIASPGEPGMTWSSWTVLVSFALLGLAIAYGLGRWGWSGSTSRLLATAVVLALAASLAVWAPWSGWPHVFAATALGLLVEHRRRVGSVSAATAVTRVLAGLAFAVATVLCLFT